MADSRFLKLLPDHLHGRGDSVLPRLRYQTELSAPLPYQEWPERPRKMSRSGHPSCSPSPPRMPGPREAAPRSILNDPVQLHNPASAHQQPARHSPIFSSSTSHYQSPHASPQGHKRTLPPIPDFHRRSDEFEVYPCGYEQQTVLEMRHPMSQSLPTIPCLSTPVSPAASQTRLFPSSNPNQQYGLYQTPYGAELDYPSPHAIKAQNSPVRVAVGDPGEGRHKKRRGNLPKPVTDILRTWFHKHLDHPYPSEEDKQMFMTRTGLTISQVSRGLPTVLSCIRFCPNWAYRSAIGSSTPGGGNSPPYAIGRERPNRGRIQDKDPLLASMKKKRLQPKRLPSNC